MRTVEKRWETSTVMAPVVCATRRAPSAYCSNRLCSACASRAEVGSSSRSSRGDSRIMARPSASFCHWPPLRSVPPTFVLPRVVASPSLSRRMTSSARARSRAAPTATASSMCGRSPSPTVCCAENSNRAKSWNPAEMRSRHSVYGHAGEVYPINRDGARVGVIEAAQQFDQRRLARTVFANDRHCGARGNREVHVLKHRLLGARVREGDVVQLDTRRQGCGYHRVGRGALLALDNAAHPADLREHRRRPLQPLEHRHRRGHLVVYLRRERDHHEHVAHGGVAAHRVAKHQQRGANVGDGEEDLAAPRGATRPCTRRATRAGWPRPMRSAGAGAPLPRDRRCAPP